MASIVNMELKCLACSYEAKTKTHFKIHQRSEKHRQNQTRYDQIIESDNLRGQLEAKILESLELKNQLEAKTVAFTNLKTQFEVNHTKITYLEKDITNLTEQRDQFKTLVEKAVIKPNIVNTSQRVMTNTNMTNNLILSSEPIRYSTLKEDTRKHITAEVVLQGDKKYAETVITNFLQDAEGNSKVICTDLSRQNFQYQDEKTGKIMSDPQLSRFKKAFSECIYKNSELRADLYEATRLETKDNEPDAELAMNHLFRASLSSKVIKYIAKKTYKNAIINFKD